MQSIELRKPFPTEAIDPLSVAPDPGKMGKMYIGAREKYKDGMTLACATPRDDYETIKQKYAEQRDLPGFSDVEFLEANFDIPLPDQESVVAEPGQPLDEYIQTMRGRFIFSNEDQKGFDIWLPYDRSVAGIGRFGRHSFTWDGYHMAKGYAADGKYESVLNVTDNTEYLINRYGYPLNGSADFYATRPQPDYFSHEVRMLADRIGPEALVRYLPAMERNHIGYWMDGYEELSKMPDDGRAHAYRALVRMPDGSFLNRYWDDADGPRLESYKEDVKLGEFVVAGLEGVARERRLQKLYKDLRGGAGSGHDFSSRFFKDGLNLHTINTTDIAPVDLNSLMAYNEETLAMAYEAAAETEGYEVDREECLRRAKGYRGMVKDRVGAINTYLWSQESGTFRDFNFVDDDQTSVVSAAMTYPLYVGIANDEQTFSVAKAVEGKLLRPGGVIATTTMRSREQWDGLNVWAPLNWAAARGFARMGHLLEESGELAEPLFALSEKVKASYIRGVEDVYDRHGIVPEKHRGDDPTVLAGGGEYDLVKLLGMSLETYRAMQALEPRDASDHLPMAKLALAAA